MEPSKKHRYAVALGLCVLVLALWSGLFPPRRPGAPAGSGAEPQAEVQGDARDDAPSGGAASSLAKRREPPIGKTHGERVVACEGGSEPDCRAVVQTEAGLSWEIVGLAVFGALAVWWSRRAAKPPRLAAPIASGGRRIAAVVAEYVLFGAVFLGLRSALHLDRGWGAAIFGVAAGVIFTAYTVGAHALYGRNFGKWAAGIALVRLDGRRIGWREALVRSSVDLVVVAANALIRVSGALTILARIPDASLTRLTALSFVHAPLVAKLVVTFGSAWAFSEALTVYTNEDRRAIHDLLAGTVVVERARSVPSAVPLAEPADTDGAVEGSPWSPPRR